MLWWCHLVRRGRWPELAACTFRNAAPPQRWGDRRVAKGRPTSKTLDIVVAACRAHAISAEETAEVPSSTCILRHWQAKAVVTTLIRLRFDCNSTALQPLDHLRYDRTPTCVWLLHCGLNKLCGRPPQYAPPLQVHLWPFDLESRVRIILSWATSTPSLVFLGLSVLDLGTM